MAVGTLACADPSATPTDIAPGFAPGSDGPPIRITATDPPAGDQGTTLTVRVVGSNFEPGSVAEFQLADVPPGKVRTNSTVFVSSEELEADVTIDADAEIGLYDVAVTTPGGKKGVGTELFQVKQPGATVQGTYVLTDWEGAIWSESPIEAGFCCGGGLWAETGNAPKKGRGGDQSSPELCVDLSRPGGQGIVSRSDYEEFLARIAADESSTGISSVYSRVTMHSRDHSNPEQMVEQPVGSNEYGGGKIVLKDLATSKGDTWEWRLIWDVEGPLRDLPERGRGICVDHPDAGVWYVFNTVDVDAEPVPSCFVRGIEIDPIVRLVRMPDFVRVAEFVMPFRYTMRWVER